MNIQGLLINFAVTLLTSLLVFLSYKGESFPADRRYSTFWPRFWTGSVDSCVLWPIAFLSNILLVCDIPKVLGASVVIVESFAWLIYTVVMHARFGQTVGKMVTKVRVVDFRTERMISWRQAWLREGIPGVLSFGIVGYEAYEILTGDIALKETVGGQSLSRSGAFWFVAALPVLWFLAEVLTMLTNQKRRALHDFIAGTVVVRTNIREADTQPGAILGDGSTGSVGGATVAGGV